MASVKSFVTESYHELMHKVTWPTFSEVQTNAILVFIASLIIALLVFLMDYVFGVQQSEWTDEFTWRGLLGSLYKLLQQ